MILCFVFVLKNDTLPCSFNNSIRRNGLHGYTVWRQLPSNCSWTMRVCIEHD